MSRRPPSSPPEIPGFRYVELLGSGGFADVFKYEEIGLGSQQLGFRGRAVGVKVLLRGLREDAQEAFESEAAAMAQLSNHPHIVSIFRAGQAMDGRAYLVMAYCPPPHLDTQIRRSPLQLPRALRIGIQIASAVETAHRAGILHRDIKPANILFTEFGEPALTDFGISASTAAGSRGQAVGMSVPWASPEQLTSAQPMGPSGDVYSLAATLHTMLAGHAPFFQPNGNNDNVSMGQRIVSSPVPKVGREDVPDSVERLLALAMSKRPEQRFSSALEFAHALQHIQTQLRMPVTDIPLATAESPSHDDEDSGGTRVSGFAQIDPDAPPISTREALDHYVTGVTLNAAPTTDAPQSPVIRHGRGSAAAADPIEFTGPAVPELVAWTPVPDPSRPRLIAAGDRPRRSRLTAAALGALLIGGAALGALALRSMQTPATTANPAPASETAKPKDAVGPIVPSVTDLVLEPKAGAVAARWVNPLPAAGDSYLYRIVDPASPKEYSTTDSTTVTVPLQPGRTCLEVVLRRSTGRSSSATAACVVTQ